MRRMLGVVVAVVAVSGGAVAAQATDPKAVDQGRRLYTSYKCDKCHMVNGRGSKKGPLDGVGSKLSAADIKKWFTDTAEMESKLEKPPKGTDSMANALKTKGIEPAEVDLLVAYLRSLTRR